MNSTPYNVEIDDEAEKEFKKLPKAVKDQFKKKIRKLVDNPHSGHHLGGPLSGFYKIVALRAGYRLVYQVIDDRLVILIVAAGKRAEDEVYEIAKKRLGR